MPNRRTITALLACLCLAGTLEAAPQAPAQPAAQAPAGDTAQQPLVVLRLKDNSLLVGRVVREDATTVVFDAGALGQLTLKTADIIARLDPATVAAAFQAPQQNAAPPAQTGLSGFTGKGKVIWTKTFTGGGTFTSAAFKQGVIDQRFPTITGKTLKLPGNQYVAQLNLVVMRASERGVGFLDGSWTYAKYDPFGKQADNPKLSIGYNFKIGQSKRFYGVSRYTYYEDQVKQVDYSNQALFGIGTHAVAQRRVKLDLVPGVALIEEKKGTRFDGQLLKGWGGLEQLVVNPNRFSQFEQREFFYQAFDDTSYYGLESYVGYKGMLSKQLGVSIGFTHIIDNAIAARQYPVPANSLYPGQPVFNVEVNNKTQTFVTAGMLIRF